LFDDKLGSTPAKVREFLSKKYEIALSALMEKPMDIYLILRIALVGILVSVLNQILKQSNRDDLAFLTSLAGLVLVLMWLLPHITELFITIQQLFNIV
jgi:stage III sporulation protein AC